MLAFLSARLRAWVFMAVAVPLFFAALSLIRRKVEERNQHRREGIVKPPNTPAH